MSVTKVRPTHLQIMADELARRVAKNPRYSIRAYAKSLGIHPSALSRIFSGKQTLSLRTCPKILEKLQLDAAMQRHFLDSVAEEAKTRAHERLGTLLKLPIVAEGCVAEPSRAAEHYYGEALHEAVGGGGAVAVSVPKEKVGVLRRMLELFARDAAAYLAREQVAEAYRVELAVVPVGEG